MGGSCTVVRGNMPATVDCNNINAATYMLEALGQWVDGAERKRGCAKLLLALPSSDFSSVHRQSCASYASKLLSSYHHAVTNKCEVKQRQELGLQAMDGANKGARDKGAQSFLGLLARSTCSFIRYIHISKLHDLSRTHPSGGLERVTTKGNDEFDSLQDTTKPPGAMALPSRRTRSAPDGGNETTFVLRLSGDRLAWR